MSFCIRLQHRLVAEAKQLEMCVLLDQPDFAALQLRQPDAGAVAAVVEACRRPIAFWHQVRFLRFDIKCGTWLACISLSCAEFHQHIIMSPNELCFRTVAGVDRAVGGSEGAATAAAGTVRQQLCQPGQSQISA